MAIMCQDYQENQCFHNDVDLSNVALWPMPRSCLHSLSKNESHKTPHNVYPSKFVVQKTMKKTHIGVKSVEEKTPGVQNRLEKDVTNARLKS